MTAPFDATAVARVRDLLAARPPRLLIGGEWVKARSGVTRDTEDPSTGTRLSCYAEADGEDVDSAVQAALDAQLSWSRLGVAERGRCFLALAQLVEEHADELALADALDAGLPVLRMQGDVAGAVRALRGWPGLASAFRGDVLPAHDTLHYTRHAPFGVVAKIVAYNHPLLFAIKGSLAALIAGNCLVLKPADQTPMSALLVGDLVQQSFPPGVFNIVTGSAAAGEAMVTHRDVNRIAFTGSATVGRRIQQAAARDQVRSVTLELGGKNPMIVLPDSDPVQVAGEVVKAMNLRANQGQSCGSTSRLLVHDDIAAPFVARLREILEALSLGPACDPDFDLGPLITQAHRERVHGHIRDGLEAGADLVTGGLEDPRIPDRGHFVAPTLFDRAGSEARLVREEIFGPVMTVQRWSSLDEALQLANGVEYGLTASIWTRDIQAGLRLADAVEAGYVWVNDSTTHHWGTPFGGWKNSGIGREESLEEYQSYLQTKSVHVKLHP